MKNSTKKKLLKKFKGKEISKRSNKSLTIQFTSKEKEFFVKTHQKALKYGGKLKWLKELTIYSTGFYNRINIDK